MARKGTPPDALALALAAGRTVRQAAAAAKVSERTAFRRLADPAFVLEVATIRGDMVRTAAGRLADGMAAAADVLREQLTNPDQHVRHKAAVRLLELGVRLVETAELERRLQELERRLIVKGE
ncbi:hypothetical protein [Fimbriiglobus ruber]|uniref:Uncharacterized protein n=1 Tax=Fimbriiglobus ruber TaxID=1908690 RepID=A0A225DGP3_9BACT|nr:hypothetical protein [Fimbriiglobus ruber]OWK35565.1 hypothetical protein FRUB_08128 [Fimbriiglobus ruber]